MQVDTEARTRAARLLAAAQALESAGSAPLATDSLGLSSRAADMIAWRLNSGSEMQRALQWQERLQGVLLPKSAAAQAALEATVEALLTAALCAPSRKALAEVRIRFACCCTSLMFARQLA